ncbi:hypothetical protein GCM10017786_24510 [Amycolatopsis deserti]|uniref:Uncharacterized protein n=1 Tax=Amycolatopsis deserti TaxID=185696 RepID=A0ABQ3IT90_9PSEU|nr:hypothetical protein GCM10017786_24510 [Amycolatopsis deserti]
MVALRAAECAGFASLRPDLPLPNPIFNCSVAEKSRQGWKEYLDPTARQPIWLGIGLRERGGSWG